MGMLSPSQKKSLARAATSYAASVQVAEEYLAGRGISLELAQARGLGVVTDPIPGHEGLRNMLAIPYQTENGPVNMAFRCLRKHDCKATSCAKYMNAPGAGTNMFSVQSFLTAGSSIAICEGEIDTISANIAGITAVGVSGSTKWKAHWTRIFEDFTNIYIMQDGDSAGKEFGDKMVQKLGAVRVVMPDGEDVNSMLVKHGAAALRALIRR
jgi:5S rRNA maturation endonuclease (ribonuclease M5)